MPGKGIRNAVYKRAGGKGQSSKFYNIYGKVVKPTDPNGFKGGQGWTAPQPQIGSMLSLGIMKQNRNAGGANTGKPFENLCRKIFNDNIKFRKPLETDLEHH